MHMFSSHKQQEYNNQVFQVLSSVSILIANQLCLVRIRAKGFLKWKS